MKRILVVLIVGVVACFAAVGYYGYRPLATGTFPVEFDLKPGASLKSAATQLEQAKILDDQWKFVLLARLMGKSSQIKAGNYELRQAVTPMKLLEMITLGEFSRRKISTIEGWTFRQFRNALDKNKYLSHDSTGLSDLQILQRIGATETQAEGLFFPDTYHFVSGSSDLSILKMAYRTMQRRLEEAWAVRDEGLPLRTPYEALILASIVEKETGTAEDRSMIAGVFINRLRKNMLLQTDPTVIYGMGERFDGNLRKRDLLKDTPYNTYIRRGLTPTPIALPGMAVLQATLHPAKTDALYFVGRGDGSSQFSSNLSAHNRAVKKYQQ
jgi:UPF0755 protein